MKKTIILCLIAVVSAQNTLIHTTFASASNTSSGVTFTPAPDRTKLPKVPRVRKTPATPVVPNTTTRVVVPSVTPTPAAYREVTLIATAYYSPLPDQKYYLRGNHQAEIILNGKGTNGASGKAVFQGMLAAPKGYDFGTKIWIEGFGVGSVEDRGGAIVPAGQRGYQHDRIDIWMGYGEAGLARSLAWGKRTVTARIYTSKATAVNFDYSKIKLANLEKSVAKAARTTPIGLSGKADTKNVPQLASESSNTDELDKKMKAFALEKSRVQKIIDSVGTPKQGDMGPKIRLLQDVLIEMGHLNAKSTAIYGPATKSAVAKFQKSAGLIIQTDDPHAGVLGQLTRAKLVDEILYQGIEI